MSLAAKPERSAPWPARAAGGAGVPAWACALPPAVIVAVVSLVVVSAAGAPSRLVAVSHRGFGRWLTGPFAGLLDPLSKRGFGLAMLVLLATYPLAVAGARRLGLRWVLVAIVAVHAVLLAGPPLLTGDVFGYIGYARLGVLYGLSPYTHGGASLGDDPVHRFVLWRNVVSPYGPGFTLLSYAVVPLGVAGALWAFKALAVVSSLASVVLTAMAADRAGGSPARAAAFVGLNPVLLVYAVGGAHNDLLVAALSAGALVLLGRRRGAAAAGVATAAGSLKVSALLLVPYMILGARRRSAALAAALAVGAVSVVAAVLAFGRSLGGMVAALAQQQRSVSRNSVPAEVAKLLGGGIGTIRIVLSIALIVVVALTLWRAWRRRSAAGAAGWATLALVTTTAWLVPWYVVWLLPLAAVSRDRRLVAGTFAFTAFLVLTHVFLARV